jgi:anti-anti-sigma regulatory factor
MEYHLQDNGSTAEAALAGPFTFRDSEAFGSLVANIVSSAISRWTINLDKVGHLDAAAMLLLLRARDRALGSSIRVVLRGGNDQVKTAIRQARLDDLFRMPC